MLIKFGTTASHLRRQTTDFCPVRERQTRLRTIIRFSVEGNSPWQKPAEAFG